MMALFPDVNLAFALANARHEHAASANAWLETQSTSSSIGLCRVVQMGLLRLLTQRAAMQERVQSSAEAWSSWNELIRDERFAFVEKPRGIEREWSRFCASLPDGASVNTDTYLAAFAQAAGLTLVTFDRGFVRFPELSADILAP